MVDRSIRAILRSRLPRGAGHLFRRGFFNILNERLNSPALRGFIAQRPVE